MKKGGKKNEVSAVKSPGNDFEDDSVFEDADEEEEEKKAPVVAPKIVCAPVQPKAPTPIVEKPIEQPSYQVNTIKEKSTTVYKTPIQETPKELP